MAETKKMCELQSQNGRLIDDLQNFIRDLLHNLETHAATERALSRPRAEGKVSYF